MTDVKPLPDRPGTDVDTDEWSYHHRVFYRLVAGAAGSTTADLQQLYTTLAPAVYHSSLESPCSSRRWRRKLLHDLRDEGLIDAQETPRGWVWTPTDAALVENAQAEADELDAAAEDADA